MYMKLLSQLRAVHSYGTRGMTISCIIFKRKVFTKDLTLAKYKLEHLRISCARVCWFWFMWEVLVVYDMLIKMHLNCWTLSNTSLLTV